MQVAGDERNAPVTSDPSWNGYDDQEPVHQQISYQAGPRRDQPEGTYALFQDAQTFGWVDEWLFRRIQDLDYVWYDNANDLLEAPLGDFDALWVETGNQSGQFRQNWDNNLDRFEEYVAAGGVMFIEQGHNEGNQATHTTPGGLDYIWNPEEGTLNVGPEDNWLVEQMGWEEGQHFPGGNHTHVNYPVQNLDNIENSDYYQVIVVGDRSGAPSIVHYTYGDGNVIVSGSPCGHQWRNHNVEGRWGSCGEMLLEWMTLLSDFEPPPPPAIVVDPNAIEETLYTGERLDVPVTVGNEGEGELEFEVGFEITGEPERGPRRDNPGDILGQYNSGVSSIGGMTSTLDGRIWGCSYSQNRVVSMNIEDGEVLSNWGGPGSPLSMVWQGEELWVCAWSGNVITRYNLDGQRLGTFNMPFRQICGMGWDGAGLVFMNSLDDRNVHVINIENRQQVGLINYRAAAGNADIWGIEWVEHHPDGQLWCNTRNRFYQVAVSDNWQCQAVQNFATNGDQPYVGPGHDGENIWHGMWGNTTWYKRDDGVAETQWLSIAPTEGVVAPGESTEFCVILDAAGIAVGDYSADIMVYSDDPENEEILVDLVMTVEEGAALRVVWEEDFGYPALMDWNLMYNELFAGGPYEFNFCAVNLSGELVIISDLLIENQNFTIPFEDDIEIEPGAEVELTITFDSEESGVYEGELVIVWNDPDEEDYVVSLCAQSFVAPEIIVEPQAIEDELFVGAMSEYVVEVSNAGEADLVWGSSWEVVGEPEVDQDQRSVRRIQAQAGPRRDPLEEGMIDGMHFAVFTTNSNWGWIDEGMRRDPLLNGENFVSFRGANHPAEVDFEEFDAIAFSLYNQQFMNAYNANMERLTEYVDGGGGLYFETGNTQGHRSPGGITNDINGGSSNGQLLVSPDPNHDNYSYLAEVFHASEPNFWNIGEVIEGSSWLHSRYSHGQFENGVNNGTLEWFQPIASMQNQPDQWGAVSYGIGGGTILTVGHPVGHCWFNWARDGGQWGSMAAEIMYYLATAGAPAWFSYEPSEGVLGQDETDEITITINAEGAAAGLYEGELTILSNDPANPEVVVSVVMDIIGAPDIMVEWDGGFGFPDVIDWNMGYEELFSGGPYDVVVNVANIGSEVLIVSDFVSNHEYFTTDFEAEFELPVGEAVDMTFTLDAAEPGEVDATITILCDDPDEEEVVINLVAVTTAPPSIAVDPIAIETDLLTGESEEHIINVANEGEAPLIGVVELETIEGDRDNATRSVRNVNSGLAPNRDRGGGPDNWDYEWRDNMDDGPEFEWIDIAEFEGVRNFNMGDDQTTGPYMLEWDFPYYDHTSDRVWVCSDGWVSPTWGGYTRSFPNYPTAQFGDMWTHSGLDWLGGQHPCKFWTNGADLAIVTYGPNYEGQGMSHQVIINGDGKITFQYGAGWQNNNRFVQQSFVGFNAVVEGQRAGFTIVPRGQGPNFLTNGRVIAFGPPSAWVSWISIDTDEFQLNQDEDIDVGVLLNADGMNGGMYEAEITFLSNDPANPEVVVDVALEIIGAPFLTVEWPEEIGYPDVIDWNGAFDPVFAGGPLSIPVALTNSGTEILVVNDIFSEHDFFGSDFEEEFEIPVGETVEMNVIFDCPVDQPDEYDAVMVFVWNNPNEEDTEVACHALSVPPPIMEVEPQAIEEELLVGEMMETVIEISNIGEAELLWASEWVVVGEPEVDAQNRSVRTTEGNIGPRRDDFGEILGQYVWNNAPVNRYKNCAYDMDNEWMWLGTYSPNWIKAVSFDDNYENIQNAVNDFRPPGNPMDMAWVGGRLYVIPWANNFLMKFDAEGRNLGNCGTPRRMCGVAASADMNLLFLMNDGNREIHIFNIGDDGNLAGGQVGQINNHRQFMQNQGCRNVEWVDAHPDGQLWIHTPNQLWNLSVNTDNWQATGLVQRLQNWGGNQEWGGVAHDGTNLWHGGYNRNNYIIIDDGVAEMNWFTYEPVEGALGQDESDEIFVMLNAMGVADGMYEGELTIYSNDPANAEVVISVVVDVIPSPYLTVEWPEEIGWPDVIDFNDQFGLVFTGGPYDIPLLITNTGTEVLVVSDAFCENEVFTTDFEEEFELPVGESVEMVVTFDAPLDAPDEYVEDLVFIWNHPNDEPTEIEMHVLATRPPIIDVDPNAIEEEIFIGSIIEPVITLSNDGEAELIWESGFETISEPDRDSDQRSIRSVENQVGPCRDEVDLGGMRFAVLQDGRGWNWLDDTMMERDPLLTRNGEDANYVTFRNWDVWNNIDFEEFNAIVYAGSRQSGNFHNAFNQNIERFMEYIDGGGGVYTETADRNAPIRLPGGFNNDQPGNSNGTLVVSPDPNDDNYSYFAEICHESQPNNWNEGERIEGNSWLHSSYSQQQFQAAVDQGTIEWFQTIAIPEGRQTAGAIAYGIGNGTVLAVGHPLGHCWTNWVQDGQWGSIAAEILYYLATSGGAGWFTYEPVEGVVGPGDSEEIFTVINGMEMDVGITEGELTIFSNDPADPEVVIPVTVEVLGAPAIHAVWDDGIGYPDVIDWNEAYPEVFAGGPYEVVVTIQSVGTEPLMVEEFISDDEAFSTNFEQEFELEPGDALDMMFIFDAAEPGEYDATMTIISDDPDDEEYVIALAAIALSPPVIWVDPGEIVDDLMTDEEAEHVITMGNDGEARLHGEIDLEITAEPELDEQERSVRSIMGNLAPNRDRRGGPDNWDYEWRDNQEDDGPEYEWVDISQFEGVRNFNMGDDQTTGPYMLEWEFPYYDHVSDRVWVCSDGWVSPTWGGYTRSFPNYPTAQFGDMWTHSGLDWLGGQHPCMFWSNGADLAIVTYGPNYEGQGMAHQVIFDGTGMIKFQYGAGWQNNNRFVQQSFVGFNAVVEGQRSGFTVCPRGQGPQHLTNGRAIGFGPAGAWVTWIAIDQTEFDLGQDEDMDIGVFLNAEGLYGGLYEADITFFSNDPADPELVVPVSLDVTGIPIIEAVWAPGFPDVINWNVMYDDLFSGGPYTVPVTLNNVGTDDLIIESILCEDEAFTADLEGELEIGAGGTAVVDFIFEVPRDAPDLYEGVMVITSNDPDGELAVNMSAECTLPPIFVWDPDAIESDLFTDDQEEFTIEIGNDGDADLDWTTEMVLIENEERDRARRSVRSIESQAGPIRDDAGDQLFAFNMRHTWIGGFDWDPDENVMWVGSYSPNWVHAYAYDGEGGIENVFDRQLNRNSMAMGFLDGIVYTNQWSENRLYRYNTDGQAIGGPIAVDCQQIMDYGTSKSEGWLFAYSGSNRNIHVYDVNNNYQRVGIINGAQVYQQMNNQWSRSLCWVDDHPDGQLWMGTNNRVWQFFVDTENWQAELVQSFPTQSNQEWLAIGHDGENLWRAQDLNQQTVRIYDDGIEELRWIVYDPTEGVIESGGSDEVFVTLDATGLIDGVYEAELTFFTNDPANPVVVIAITLNVTGVARVAADFEAINWNEIYEELYTGGGYPVDVTITNVGTDLLIVEDISCENNVFTADPADFELEIGGEMVVTFTLFAEDDGAHDGVMLVTSNDPDSPLEIPVSGETAAPPILEVDPLEIADELMEGDVEEYPVNISNVGDSDLRWWTDHEVTGEPELDQNGRSVRRVEDGQQVGPRRDDPPESAYALFQEINPWGGDIEGLVFRPIEGLMYDRYRRADFANIELGDYDVVWVCHSEHDDGFNQAWNANRERFEEFVDDGGAYYAGTGTNRYNVTPIHPGGLRYTNAGSSNGRVQVQGQDPNADNYNYLAELMDWQVNTQLRGSSLFHVHYLQDHVNNIENSDWQQVIVSCESHNTPGIIAYAYGGGFCVVAGTTDGHQHRNWAQAPNWGSAGEELIYYLDYLANTMTWLSYEPTEGVLGPDADEDIIVTINTEGLFGGLYEAELYIFSNDPIEVDDVPDATVMISIEVTGQGRIMVEPGGPDLAQIDFGIVYVDYPETIEATLSNVGTDLLVVDGFETDNDAFYISDDVEFPIELEPEEFAPLPIVFDPIEDGEGQEGTILMITNDLGWEEGYPVTVGGDGLIAPVIFVEPDGINEVVGEEAEQLILNVANEGGSQLDFVTEFAEVENERDEVVGRCVRGVEDGLAPTRDRRGGPDNWDYEWRDNLEDDGPEYEWVDIRQFDGVRNFNMGDDQTTGPYMLEWEFPYYDHASDRVWVCSDGWVSPTWGGYTRSFPNYPTAQFGDMWTHSGLDWLGGNHPCMFWTNGQDLAIVTYGPNYEGQGMAHQVIINGDGMITFQYGDGWQNNNRFLQQSFVGFNAVVEGQRSGFTIVPRGQGPNLLTNGRAIGFGPSGAWLSWFVHEPAEGSLAPDEDMDIEVTLNPEGLEEGVYQGVLSFLSNDPETPVFDVPVTMSVGVEPPGMLMEMDDMAVEMNVADDAHTEVFMIGAAEGEDRIDLEFDIIIEGGDWLTVDPDAGTLAAGEEVEIAVTIDPAGMEPDNEYNAAMCILSNDPEHRETIVNVILTTMPDIRPILLELGQNWNMISINVDPEQFYADDEDRGPDVIAMFEGLRVDEDNHRIILLKNEDGLFWTPAWGFCNIPYWDVLEGYQVNMMEAADYEIEGAPVPPDTPIPLEPLWNIVAYLPQYDLDASAPDFYVLSSIIEDVFLAKDNDGRFLSPRFNFSNMDPWTEGQAYQVKNQSDEEIFLIYPPEQEEAAFAGSGSDLEGHWIAPVSSSENMSVLVTSVSGVELGKGDQIAAYNSKGVVIGIGNVSDDRAGLAVWGDDESTVSVEGALNGEEFTLTLWDADRQVEVGLDVSTVLEGMGLVYETNAFTALDLNIKPVIPDNYYLTQNFPNPFNSTTRIAYGMPEAGQVSVVVFDLTGRKVTELVNGEVNAGVHTLVWDANTAPAGIYLVQMETTSGFKSIRKVMLVK